jgi:hypothetical protein
MDGLLLERAQTGTGIAVTLRRLDGLVNGLGAVGGRRDFLRLRDTGGRPARKPIEFKQTSSLASVMPASTTMKRVTDMLLSG